MRLLVCTLLLAVAAPAAFSQAQTAPAPTAPPPASSPILTSTEAAQHVGELRTVCGDIVNMHTAAGSHGAPTFVDLDQAWPHQIFDIVIWGQDKETVGTFPKSGKVCASGRIILYRNRPEILLTDWHSWYVPN
ncbi:MAG: hypothetical protein WBD46_20190 [Acidobacteriaceae bacterium]